jgi:hypothetical protein
VVAVTVRFVTHGSKGYSLIVVDGEDVDGIGRRYVAIHRLAAFAWGVLDSMDDDLDVHHIQPVPWFNAESNLEALPADEHARITRRDAAARRRGSA